ncbi:S-adenosyl-L-methionine-dependent methyltransferase [Lentithecium fluviatile CBS 122367]|uniref:S-adenosyl-L-methionine-dependent methyltransferase n=1 Tax=Lentithecium fluviatile CBS 122367 TaxID=1168545 RepID=A0A6G1IUT1_9PLEO|nr:S-adenosyl-L-methionine-dependent methyltransferase [Lentithecium fluviatile CBS 122367]
MTQPTSVNMTFDTSLVDLNTSFSTTESDPSDVGQAHPTRSTPSAVQTPVLTQEDVSNSQSQETPKQSQVQATSPTPVQHLPTQDAYDQWALVYDSDGNMLQAIDDMELTELLAYFLAAVATTGPASPGAINILELGCGTGRNTAKLLLYPWPSHVQVSITALDFSRGMLNQASTKLASEPRSPQISSLNLHQTDCFPTMTNPAASPVPNVPGLETMDAIISTLVLEHIPLQPYFATLSSLLAPGGIALVTNMHSEMGLISQAGFVNAQGVKVRGKSYAHTVEETVAEAQRAGFEVLDVQEQSVKREDVESGRVGERGKKWVGTRVWYGLWLRKGKGRPGC